MRRPVAFILTLVLSISAGANAAMAAAPSTQACLGKDFSSYARSGAPGPCSRRMAGLIPDSYVINSCNDR